MDEQHKRAYRLRDNEEIIWQGKPGKSTLPTAQVAGFVATGFVLGVLDLWAAVDFIGLPEQATENEAGEMVTNFMNMGSVQGIVGVLAICTLLFPFFVQRAMAAKEYVVTNKRLIDVDSNKEGTIHSNSLWYDKVQFVGSKDAGDGLSNVRLREPGAAGDAGEELEIKYLPQEAAEYVAAHCHSKG